MAHIHMNHIQIMGYAMNLARELVQEPSGGYAKIVGNHLWPPIHIALGFSVTLCIKFQQSISYIQCE